MNFSIEREMVRRLRSEPQIDSVYARNTPLGTLGETVGVGPEAGEDADDEQAARTTVRTSNNARFVGVFLTQGFAMSSDTVPRSLTHPPAQARSAHLAWLRTAAASQESRKTVATPTNGLMR
jgi:hypothetical protein